MATYMDEFDVTQACRIHRDHPVLGPAAGLLFNLMTVVNENSDGWPYWNAPQRASERLRDLLQGRLDPTPEHYKRAVTPVKAFLTRKGLSCPIPVLTREGG
jgi:hypothetical protein